MRVLAQKLSNNPSYASLFKWGKLLTISSSAQIVVQAIGFICGILIIRMLPAEEYALYTLANTMLGTMTLLADGGITAGVFSQGGKVWQEPEKLGSVLATGIDLRKKFAIGSLLIAVPVLLYLLLHHGASWPISILIVLSLILPFFTALTGQLYEIIPRLWQDIAPIQKIQVTTNIVRLILLCLTIFVFPLAFVAILITGIPQLWSNLQLKKLSGTFILPDQKPDPAVRKEILSMIKRIMPGVVYYCMSSQITVWIISVFGSTESIAKVGALSRLAMVITFITVLFNTLISPRFARLENDSKLLLKRFFQILSALLILSLALLAFVSIFPDQILWVLGDSYKNLQFELILFFTGSCLSLIATSCYNLYLSRGWTINPFISIPVNIASIVGGALLFEISTIQGIFIMNIFIALIQVLMDLIFTLVKINQTGKTHSV